MLQMPCHFVMLLTCCCNRQQCATNALRWNEACSLSWMNSPLVSVVVPTCGRIALLARCVDSLCAQTLRPDQFELIVVDDSRATDPSAQTAISACCAQARRRGLSVHCLRNTGRHGPAAARNLGWRAARSAWVGFTDDDTIAQPDWLARACVAFTAGNADAAAADALWGNVAVPLPALPTDYERDAGRLQQAGFVTANCFCRRALLERIGGFDERFRVAWREDTDLYFRLCDAGARVLFVGDAVVLHPVRPAGWLVSLTQQRKILFDALLYKKHRRRYRQTIRRAPRWDYYLCTVALALGIAALPAGQPVLAALALPVWLLSVGAFFRRRLRGTSRQPSAVAALLVTSVLIPPLAVFWRAVGAIRFRTFFL